MRLCLRLKKLSQSLKIMNQNNFISIDEDGYCVFGELRVQDPFVGNEILTNLGYAKNGALSSISQGTPVLVESFDEPLVASQVYFKENTWKILCPYETWFDFKLEDLSLDEWDRFHGYTKNEIPFVFSRKAQAEFFNLLEDYDDESISFQGKTYEIPNYFSENKDIHSAKFWTEVYHKEGNPRWNLGDAAPALKDMLPRIKIPKSRILVLGCSEGHDAAFFAKDGHIVTAVDFSAEAVERAKKLYGKYPNLIIEQHDIFKLPESYNHAFDYVFEHTCFCAIDPTKRNELIKIWKRVLTDEGHIIGVFFTMEKRKGPPYGGSEWELRERMKKHFQFIFWGRWRQSVPSRQGKELFVFAKKI